MLRAKTAAALSVYGYIGLPLNTLRCFRINGQRCTCVRMSCGAQPCRQYPHRLTAHAVHASTMLRPVGAAGRGVSLGEPAHKRSSRGAASLQLSPATAASQRGHVGVRKWRRMSSAWRAHSAASSAEAATAGVGAATAGVVSAGSSAVAGSSAAAGVAAAAAATAAQARPTWGGRPHAGHWVRWHTPHVAAGSAALRISGHAGVWQRANSPAFWCRNPRRLAWYTAAGLGTMRIKSP